MTANSCRRASFWPSVRHSRPDDRRGISCGLPPGGTTDTAARAVAQAPTAPPADVDKSAGSCTSYGCYQCHGYEGQGSSVTGPRLGPRPLPLAMFSWYVRRPTGIMPPYTGQGLVRCRHGEHPCIPGDPAGTAPVESIPLLK